LGCVNVQGTVGLGRGKKLLHGLQSLFDRIYRTPTRLEKIQTYLSSLEMHIRMTDGSDKGDGRRLVGICVWDDDVEFPEAIYGYS
jgi:hypothetical protein